MARRTYVRTDVPDDAREANYVDDGAPVVERETTVSPMRPWSPAQIIGLIIGIGFTVLGIAAVARTGFDTSHIYTPHDVVWHFPHSPLLAVCEIGFGVLLILASLVPGAARPIMGLLGVISLVFGIVILVDAATNNLNHHFAVTHRSGWLFTIAGAVLLLTAMFAPVFFGTRRRREVRSATYA